MICEKKYSRLENTWKDWYLEINRGHSSSFIQNDIHDILQQFHKIWDVPLPPNYDVATLRTANYEKEIRAFFFACGITPRMQRRKSGHALRNTPREAVPHNSPTGIGTPHLTPSPPTKNYTPDTE